MIEALRRILDAVSSKTNFEEALQVLASLVKEALVVDVASVFLLDEELQTYILMASDGLNSESIGVARLEIDQGLVGLVGQREELLNLAVADSHPRFQFIENSGEEAFSSFLSVPIIHRKKVLGVLVVQRAAKGKFSVADERFLITLSAQVASVIVSSEARSAVFSKQSGHSGTSKSRFLGTSAAAGLALGIACVVDHRVGFDSVELRKIEDTDQELEQFEQAIELVRQDLFVLQAQACEKLQPRELALFDVYIHMLDDIVFTGEIIDGIHTGIWAAGALKQVVQKTAARFMAMEDDYFRSRATDIEDLGLRLLSRLLDVDMKRPEVDGPVILVGQDVSATTLLEWPREKLAGVVSLQGTSNSHMAIIARAIELPAVVGIPDLPIQSLHHEFLVLDGFRGEVIVNPSVGLKSAYERFQRQERRVVEGIDAEFDQPAKTACGLDICILANTGFLTDGKLAHRRGAQGVGLFRTEISFMGFDSFPSEAEQVQIYREHLESFAPYPVTMRTLDIGGDKSLPYFPIHETNPFLGWRGIRVTLDHPEILMVQVRAMLKASEGLDNLRILLPMVSNVDEVDLALRLIHRAFEEVHEEEAKVVMPKIGVMLEVPAAVMMAKAFADRVDFLSVGTNDLIQYLLAVDRNNPKVSDLYQAYHPVVIQTLANLALEMNNFNIDLSICGEIAGDPALAAMLVGMGYRTLSMSASSLLRVKWVLRRLTLQDMEELVDIVKCYETSDACKDAVLNHLSILGIGEVVHKGVQTA